MEEMLFEIVVTGLPATVTVFRPETANSYTPSRSIILLLPAQIATDTEQIHQYLEDSGWLRQAQKDASVLIIPHSQGSWTGYTPHFIVDIYQALWGKVRSIEQGDFMLNKARTSHDAKIPANVWMWETLWSIVGYEDGADLAGDCVVAHPNRFASATFLGGVPHAFAYGENPSDHFLVSKTAKRSQWMTGVSADYDVKMCQIPSAVWIIDQNIERAEIRRATEYFCHCNGSGTTAATMTACCGMPTSCWANSAEPDQRVWLSEGDWHTLTPEQMMRQWIGPSVRWKNSPDGTLKTFYWKEQIVTGKSPYNRHVFHVPGERSNREYYVYAPKKLSARAPVVLSIHGHGEPAWMFLSKNGWPQLADREGMLIVSPESHSRNRWIDAVDTDSFSYLLEDVSKRYDIDSERIYISGFSNGNQQCYNVAAKYPQLFAGMFPMSQAAADAKCLDQLKKAGVAMPLFGVTGDNDGWSIAEPENLLSGISQTIEVFCALSGVQIQPAVKPAPLYWQPDETWGESFYREKLSLMEAGRFTTWVYKNKTDIPLVAITVMKNMPHGSIWDEVVAAWFFLKRFRRLADGTLMLS